MRFCSCYSPSHPMKAVTGSHSRSGEWRASVHRAPACWLTSASCSKAATSSALGPVGAELPPAPPRGPPSRFLFEHTTAHDCPASDDKQNLFTIRVCPSALPEQQSERRALHGAWKGRLCSPEDLLRGLEGDPHVLGKLPVRAWAQAQVSDVVDTTVKAATEQACGP